jgi:hypothetical protein
MVGGLTIMVSAFLALAARYWQLLAGIGAALGVLLYGRHQRGQGAAERETKLRADAAQQMQERTNAGNEAAGAAERDGGVSRMQRGEY